MITDNNKNKTETQAYKVMTCKAEIQCKKKSLIAGIQYLIDKPGMTENHLDWKKLQDLVSELHDVIFYQEEDE
jgi:hypothetical protein